MRIPYGPRAITSARLPGSPSTSPVWIVEKYSGLVIQLPVSASGVDGCNRLHASDVPSYDQACSALPSSASTSSLPSPSMSSVRIDPHMPSVTLEAAPASAVSVGSAFHDPPEPPGTHFFTRRPSLARASSSSPATPSMSAACNVS